MAGMPDLANDARQTKAFCFGGRAGGTRGGKDAESYGFWPWSSVSARNSDSLRRRTKQMNIKTISTSAVAREKVPFFRAPGAPASGD